jgi:predicted methyltransferase MtxX (methanogen marker protein 4)
MTLEEAKTLAQQGVKVTHEYFTSDEYMTMQGNIIIFEDGVEIFFDEWIKGKDYLLQGWSIY